MNYASILVKKLTLSRMSQNLYVRLGFLGNQPFFTLSSSSKTSLMVQKEEKANGVRAGCEVALYDLGNFL